MEHARELQDNLAELWSQVLAKNCSLGEAIRLARQLVTNCTREEQYGALSGLVRYIYDDVVPESPAAARVFGQIVQEACLQVTDLQSRDLLLSMSGFRYGKLLIDMGHHELALDVLPSTLEALRQLPADKRASLEATTLMHLGIACTRTARLDAGFRYYEQSLNLIHAAGLATELPRLYFNIGINCALRNQIGDAIDFFQRAINTGRIHAPNAATVPLAMLEIARLLDRRSDAEQIQRYLEEALPRLERLGLGEACNDAHVLLALTCEATQGASAAIAHLENALAVGTPSDEKLLYCVEKLVSNYLNEGRREDACSTLESVLQAAELVNREEIFLPILQGLAHLLFAGSSIERLVEVCNRGAELAAQRHDNIAQALFLGYLSDAYGRLGREDEFRLVSARAWKAAAEIDPESVTTGDFERMTQLRIGPWSMTFTRVGDTSEKEPTWRALRDTQPTGIIPGVGAIYRERSDLYRGARFFFRQGIRLAAMPDAWSYVTGQDFLQNALQLYSTGDHLWEAQAVASAMGRSHEVHRSGVAALACYKESVRLLELYRGHLADHDNRISYLARCAEAFRDAVRMSARNGDVDTAYEFAERSKARSLVELLVENQQPSAAVLDHFPVEDVQRELLDDDTALLQYLLA